MIAAALALGASTTAHAASFSHAATVADEAVDGFCDPFNDVDDPDCWEDTGEDETVPAESVPEYVPPPQPEPVEPTPPPVINWPAPPKGAYARLRPNGRTAIAPKSAPKPIRAMIRAANSITKRPYKWGGGHGRWYDKGYDCSGATSFVLRAGGYLSYPLVSGGLAKWGARGAGNWVRIYANKNHVFMVIAGLRFDTSAYGAGGGKGPRWRASVRPTGGFKLRHPAGL